MVTRNDVAKHAGVSVAVVSYVINNKNNVKEPTRQKVLRSIAELGYNPNMAARSLKTKKANQLGVLFNSLGNPFETGISLGLEERARQYGHSLIFQTYVAAEEDQLKTIFMGRTDGLILLGQSLRTDTIEHFAKLDIPICSITTPAAAHSYVRCFDIRWDEAMLDLISHLKALGHRRIGFLANMNREHHHHVRYEQFRKALAVAGLVFDEQEALLEAPGRLESAYELMSERLKSHVPLPFTALVCANDLMGIGVLSACRDSGLSVPDDLSVAGCENILMASHTTPALTTIHYPRRELGFMTIESLMQLSSSEDGHESAANQLTTLDYELLIRSSTSAPPQR